MTDTPTTSQGKAQAAGVISDFGIDTTAQSTWETVRDYGIRLRSEISIDPGAGSVTIDLRDNPDCVPAGLNLSQATSISAAAVGVFNSIDADVPHNAGSFRCLDIALRENAVVGRTP